MFTKIVQNRSSILGYKQFSTVDIKEIKHFEKLSLQWWDEFGIFKALHAMNGVRVPFISNGICQTNPNIKSDSSKPLNGIKILDVGCGGGILCEPLARLGAKVTGIDANLQGIEVAKKHALSQNLDIEYRYTDIEEHSREFKEYYDVVVSSEVIEHVNEKGNFVAACTQCLKNNGSIFFTTFNKTWLANILGIYAAEQLLCIIPKGTHEYEKFCEPHKLERMLLDNDCKTICVNGLIYNFLTNKWSFINSHQLTYALHAVKVVKKEE